MKSRLILHITLLLMLEFSAGCQSSPSRIGEYKSLVGPKALENGEETFKEIVQTQALQPDQKVAATKQTTETNRWTRWMERFRQPKRIPVPRTDLQYESEKTELVDLQQQLGEF